MKLNMERVRMNEPVWKAARRYGVGDEVIERGLRDGHLFRAVNPRTGISMVCGELPERKRDEWDVGEYGLPSVVLKLVFGTVKGVAANLLWFVIWVTVILTLGINGNAKGAMIIGLTVGMGKFIWAVHDEKKQRESGKIRTVYVGDDYSRDDGGIFGWHVPCSAAKADIDWMLGKWGK